MNYLTRDMNLHIVKLGSLEEELQFCMWNVSVFLLSIIYLSLCVAKLTCTYKLIEWGVRIDINYVFSFRVHTFEICSTGYCVVHVCD